MADVPDKGKRPDLAYAGDVRRRPRLPMGSGSGGFSGPRIIGINTPFSYEAGKGIPISPDRPNRVYLLVQNYGAGFLYLAFGQVPNAITGIQIDPTDGSYEWQDNVATNGIFIFGPSAGRGVIIEGLLV